MEALSVVVGALGGMLVVIVAVVPWMFSVHGKLAVLCKQMAHMVNKVDTLSNDAAARLPDCIRHRTALDEMDRRLRAIESRIFPHLFHQPQDQGKPEP